MRITLDTNCLIYLEGSGPESSALAEVLARAQGGAFRICVPAISASERTAEGLYLENFDAFTDRLALVGLQDVEHLLPLGYWDVCFWDHCLSARDDMVALEVKIHEILHPTVAFEYSEFCRANGLPETQPAHTRWRNAKCDVQVAWSHIWHGADVLVTNDRNFVKATKLPRLLDLGAHRIITPSELPSLWEPASQLEPR